MARNRDDPDREEKRERRQRARDQQESAPPSPAPRNTRGISGYNYDNYVYQGHGRPPSKKDWDHMSQEEREAIGLPDWQSYHAAQQNWKGGFGKGGGNYNAQMDLGTALRSGGARTWDDILRIARGQGYDMKPDMGQALLKRLKMAFEGSSDPSGRYHFTDDGRAIDVATSDAAKFGRADFFGGPRMSGIEAVLAGLAGGDAGRDEQGYFDRLVSSGDWTLDPESGQYFNDPGNDASRRVWVDRNNLQVEGSGYKSTMDPTRGPTIDYSQIAPGQTIADYLKTTAVRRADEATAPPIVFPTSGSSGSSFAASGTVSTPAWGAGFGSPSRRVSASFNPQQTMQPKPINPTQSRPNILSRTQRRPAATGFGGFGAY